MNKTAPLIAVVDDDESICRAISRLLDSLGMNVDTFTSGDALLEQIETMRSFRPDCVVLDVHMPRMSGLEVQARLKESETPLPIIFITGLDEANVRERALRAGAVAFLRKPFNDELFIKTLHKALERDRWKASYG